VAAASDLRPGRIGMGVILAWRFCFARIVYEQGKQFVCLPYQGIRFCRFSEGGIELGTESLT
jgi:hypothetical protein